MQETVTSLQKAVKAYKAREAGYQETVEQLVSKLMAANSGIDRLRMRSDKQQREIGELRSRLDKLEGKSERWEREVSKFERLNNNNEWVKP